MTTNSPNFMLNSSSKHLPWWLNVITAGLFCLFLSLSYWQLDRGFQKKTVIHQAQTITAPITNQQLAQSHPQQTFLLGQAVLLQGEFDNEHFFLIDNKFYEGNVGFHVISPFKLGDNLAVLVNRGWISRETALKGNFMVAPQPRTITISGQLYKPKHNIFISRNTIESSWPQQALEIDVVAFGELLALSLYPMVVNMHHDSPYSFAGPLELGHGMTPEKHYGYSIQWLIFALILGSLWTFHRIRSRHEPKINT